MCDLRSCLDCHWNRKRIYYKRKEKVNATNKNLGKIFRLQAHAYFDVDTCNQALVNSIRVRWSQKDWDLILDSGVYASVQCCYKSLSWGCCKQLWVRSIRWKIWVILTEIYRNYEVRQTNKGRAYGYESRGEEWNSGGIEKCVKKWKVEVTLFNSIKNYLLNI